VTRNSLIVSGEASKGYYIFQLVDRSGGLVRRSQSRFDIAKRIADDFSSRTTTENM
jgi:hypothetical protein